MSQINMATEAWVVAQGYAKEGTVFHYMGSVENYAALQAIVDASIGDVYNDKETGSNYVWTGAIDAEKPNQIGWDKLSETITVSDSFTSEITATGDEAEKAVKSAAVYNALTGKVDKVTGSSLVSDTLIAKLDALATINAVNEAQLSVADGTLSVTAVDMGLVTGLATALAGKVDVATGKSLVDDTLIAKLSALATINAVNDAQLSVADGTLSVTAVDMSLVTGLDTALAGKVDKVEGSSLVTDALIAKLDALAGINSVEATQMAISESGNLAITAVDKSVVTGLNTDLQNINTSITNITQDITNICAGTKEFTSIRLAFNGKVYTLAVAENSIGQPTLYLQEVTTAEA